MSGKEQTAILIIPQDLLERTDRYRDELSRAEFIGFCIDSLLEQKRGSSSGEGKPLSFAIEDKATETVSRREFEDFARRMKGLQQLFVNFLLEYGLEPLDRAPVEGQQRFRADVDKLLESLNH